MGTSFLEGLYQLIFALAIIGGVQSLYSCLRKPAQANHVTAVILFGLCVLPASVYWASSYVRPAFGHERNIFCLFGPYAVLSMGALFSFPRIQKLGHPVCALLCLAVFITGVERHIDFWDTQYANRTKMEVAAGQEDGPVIVEFNNDLPPVSGYYSSHLNKKGQIILARLDQVAAQSELHDLKGKLMHWVAVNAEAAPVCTPESKSHCCVAGSRRIYEVEGLPYSILWPRHRTVSSCDLRIIPNQP